MLKKVRKIEIRTRSLSHQIFAGEYHSAFKGRGMAFSEVREYQFGDDVRNMDWNVTARMRSPYVKVFEEEREMTVVLLVDVSRSGLFGTQVNQPAMGGSNRGNMNGSRSGTGSSRSGGGMPGGNAPGGGMR